jgi:hypothetical protein
MGAGVGAGAGAGAGAGVGRGRRRRRDRARVAQRWREPCPRRDAPLAAERPRFALRLARAARSEGGVARLRGAARARARLGRGAADSAGLKPEGRGSGWREMNEMKIPAHPKSIIQL